MSKSLPVYEILIWPATQALSGTSFLLVFFYIIKLQTLFMALDNTNENLLDPSEESSRLTGAGDRGGKTNSENLSISEDDDIAKMSSTEDVGLDSQADLDDEDIDDDMDADDDELDTEDDEDGDDEDADAATGRDL